MATIDNKKVIDDLIKNNGYYLDKGIDDGGLPDPRVVMIVEYTNYNGKQIWGIVYENEIPIRQRRYLMETLYVRNPKIIWSAETADKNKG